MERKWETRAAMTVCAAAAIAAVVLGIRLLWAVLLPFLLAWGISLMIAPAAAGLAKKTHLARGFGRSCCCC